MPTDQAALTATIQQQDAKLFNAYNTCDLKTFRAMLADDVEFYHDKAGLMTGADNVTDAIKNNICGKTQRDLVPGTLEVHILANYGAVEIGVHTFHPVGSTTVDGQAKFTHIWHFDHGTWKLTRVISYDHEPVQKYR